MHAIKCLQAESVIISPLENRDVPVLQRENWSKSTAVIRIIDTYKIINGIYNVKTELFFDYDQSGRRGHWKKLFKEDLSWISENLHLVTEQ